MICTKKQISPRNGHAWGDGPTLSNEKVIEIVSKTGEQFCFATKLQNRPPLEQLVIHIFGKHGDNADLQNSNGPIELF